MRRYAVVQRARDADVFGILVGTLGVGPSHISLLDILLFPFTLFIYSIIPSPHPSHQIPSHPLAQEKLHHQRGEIKPLQAREFHGN